MPKLNQQFINGRFIGGRLQTDTQGVAGEKLSLSGSAATIGSFDGVHLGHQVLLEKVIVEAKARGLLSVVVVFEPQPHEFFSKVQAPARLMRLREKVVALLDKGIDRVVCLRFNAAMRELGAEQFVQAVLCDGLGVKHLTVGDDFRFGKGRLGNFSLLEAMANRCGYEVIDTQTELATTSLDGTDRISSTRIRGLLEASEFGQASRLLGKPFTVSGRVIYGKQIGRTLGFPTANIGLGRYRSPISGVFGAKLYTAHGSFEAVANVGVRPTVGERKKPILEVHALNVNKLSLNLYGSCVKVEFMFKIRDEKKFNGLDDLKRQITEDICVANAKFSR